MNVKDLTAADVECDYVRHKNGITIVTIIVGNKDITIEAYGQCKSNLENEKKLQDHILKMLGFSKKIIQDFSYE